VESELDRVKRLVEELERLQGKAADSLGGSRKTAIGGALQEEAARLGELDRQLRKVAEPLDGAVANNALRTEVDRLMGIDRVLDILSAPERTAARAEAARRMLWEMSPFERKRWAKEVGAILPRLRVQQMSFAVRAIGVDDLEERVVKRIAKKIEEEADNLERWFIELRWLAKERWRGRIEGLVIGLVTGFLTGFGSSYLVWYLTTK